MRSRLQVPEHARRGEAVAVRLLIEHPMHSGLRFDDQGRRIPRKLVHTVICRMDGDEVFRAELGSGISANPYLEFFVRAEASALLQLEWQDESGERGSAEARIEVAG